MKINIKKYKLLLILLGCFMFSFSVAFAVTDNQVKQGEFDEKKQTKIKTREAKKAEIKEKQMDALCENIANLEEKMNENVVGRKSKLDEMRSDKLAKLENKWSARIQKLEEFRLKRDEIREAHYERLLKGAQTDEQKQAVADFKDKIEQAVSDRRAMIDAERESFFDQMEDSIEGRRFNIDSAVVDLEASRDKAFSKAKSVCESGDAEVKTIRENLRNELKEAREAYQKTRKEVNNRDKVSGIVQSHQARVKEIIEDFKEISKTALDELKAVFGNISENVEVDADNS